MKVLRCITNVAAKRLGARAFKELAPHFWGFIETRPYMRAREHLAEALRTAGRLEEAVREFSELLALNENDNQGVRYLLLPSLLALHQLGEARTLMDRFKDEWDVSVVFAWGRVLERLLSGDEPGAAKALRVARKQNPHAETYLNGYRKLPKDLPGSYSHGSVEEALCYAEPLLMAWLRYPAAQAWLRAQRKPAGKPQQGPREGMEGLQAPGLN
jgi:tetratricopeptide (TPR) repeat protein